MRAPAVAGVLDADASRVARPQCRRKREHRTRRARVDARQVGNGDDAAACLLVPVVALVLALALSSGTGAAGGGRDVTHAYGFKLLASGFTTSSIVQLPKKIPSITSFGEDADGELYAVSLDGFLYALR